MTHFLRASSYIFALGLTVMALLFVRVEWQTGCALQPAQTCPGQGFVPISDSIPRLVLEQNLQELTRGWSPEKTSRTSRLLRPALAKAEVKLRERLGELSPLAASAYLFRYYRELEKDLEYTRAEEAEDLYRLLLLEALHRASEKLAGGSPTSFSTPLLDVSVLSLE